MKTIESLNNRLIDIEMPAAPPEAFDYSMTIAIIVASVLILFLIYYFLRHSNFQNLRLLSKLKENLLLSNIAPRTACYQLAELLKSIRKTKHLTNMDICSPELEHQWQYFISRLSAYRYESDDVDKTKVIKLIDESKSWLKALRP